MKFKASQFVLDAQSVEAIADALAVKLATSGGLEKSASGLQVKASAITNAMLEGSIAFAKLADNANIARLDEAETVAAVWDFGANLPTVSADPTSANQLVRRSYVEALFQGMKPKADSILCATTANMTLSGEQTIDGILTSASRVLVKNQTDPAENGIYLSSAGAWSRTTDADIWDELVSAFVLVQEGSTQADSRWLCTADDGGTLGTTAITWMDQGGTSYSAGAGLDLNSGVFSILAASLLAGGASEVDGDKLHISFTPGGYTPDTSPSEVTSANELTAHLKGISDQLGATAGAPTITAHKITAGETTAGYFTMPSTPIGAGSVSAEIVGGATQINKAILGTTGLTPDYEILSSNQFHFNNNGSGSGLSGHIDTDLVLILTYWT